MRALTFTSVLLGAKELRRWFASCVPGAQCVRPRSQVVIRFFRRSPVPVVGLARSAPSHREEVGDCHEGDVVGAPGCARDCVIPEGRIGQRRTSVRRRSYGYLLSHGCSPWCARPGVEGYLSVKAPRIILSQN